MAWGSRHLCATKMPALLNRGSAACLGLYVALALMASPAMAQCPVASCRPPSSWTTLGPLDLTARLQTRLEAAYGPESEATGTGPKELSISTTTSYIKRSDTFDEEGHSLHGAGLHLNGLYALAPDTLLAYTLAYEGSRLRTNGQLTQTDSDQYYASLALAREWGNWLGSVALTLGYGKHHAQRRLSHNAHAPVGHTKASSHSAALTLGGSYKLEGSNWYLEPGLSISMLYDHTPAYTETGLGPESARVKRDENLKFMFSPDIEFGGHIPLGGKLHFLYWASVGVNLLPDNTWTTVGYTAGEPDEVLSFDSTAPSSVGVFEIGAVLAHDRGWSLRGQYVLQTGSHYRGHSGTLHLAWVF